MKRFVLFLTLSLATFGVVSGAASARVVPTDSFVIQRFNVQLDLGRDSDGRSTLKTTETITANFPQVNVNHGLEQTIVKDYDKHSTSFRLVSVTDESGALLPYHWEGNSLRIGEKSTYVHGLKTYKITYTQRDVTKHYSDTGKDEFYWDAIGTEWRVPIEQAEVAVTVAPELRPSLQTNLQCYSGYQGSGDKCEVTGQVGEYVASAEGIGLRKGMTVALGFSGGTFQGYETSTADRLKQLAIIGVTISNVVVGPLAFIVGGALLALRYRNVSRRYRGVVGETVVPEYLPPESRTLSESARIWSPNFFGTTRAGLLVSAQLISWAVAHWAEIRETKEKSLFGSAEYTITFKKSFYELPELDQKLAKLIVGHVPKPGETLTTKKLKSRSQSILNQMKTVDATITRGDLYEPSATFESWAKRLSKASLIAGILLVSIPLFILAIIAWAMKKPAFVSESGERLHRYLEGLKMYIGVAEKERLKMLQSPAGAQKVGDVASDQGALIKLYERVLPYAILFGQEEQWAKQLGKLYETTDTSPSWMMGQGVYNAAFMGSFINSFSTTVASASSYSSSSGGSSGSGFSGGGGGGGGGGGW